MLSLGYLWCDLQPDGEEASPPRDNGHKKDEIWRRSPIPLQMDTKRFNFYAKDDSTLLRDYPVTQNVVKWKKQKNTKFEPFRQKKPETYESVSHSFGKNFSANFLNNTI